VCPKCGQPRPCARIPRRPGSDRDIDVPAWISLPVIALVLWLVVYVPISTRTGADKAGSRKTVETVAAAVATPTAPTGPVDRVEDEHARARGRALGRNLGDAMRGEGARLMEGAKIYRAAEVHDDGEKEEFRAAFREGFVEGYRQAFQARR
jgi:hypothetical protein